MEVPKPPGVSMVIRIRLACCWAAWLMPPLMYSAMIGSISSPIRISITRGRADEFEPGLVCAFANDAKANSRAKIDAPSGNVTSDVRMQRSNERRRKEIWGKERPCAVSGNSRASAGTQRQHIPASLYQSAVNRSRGSVTAVIRPPPTICVGGLGYKNDRDDTGGGCDYRAGWTSADLPAAGGQSVCRQVGVSGRQDASERNAAPGA